MTMSALFMCSMLCSLKMEPSRSNDDGGGGAIRDAGIGLKKKAIRLIQHAKLDHQTLTSLKSHLFKLSRVRACVPVCAHVCMHEVCFDCALVFVLIVFRFFAL